MHTDPYLTLGDLLCVWLFICTRLVFLKFLFVDVNNDGFLDEQELEALFTKEVKKKSSISKGLQGCLFFPSIFGGFGVQNRVFIPSFMHP